MISFRFVLFARRTNAAFSFSLCRSLGFGPVLAAACATLALTACGGGSDFSPDSGAGPDDFGPTANLPAPEKFSVAVSIKNAYFKWRKVSGATRYELFFDPDGPGPLPGSPIDNMQDFSDRIYTDNPQNENGEFLGEINLSSSIDYQPNLERLYGVYRLRACNDIGCGAFTAPQKSGFLERLDQMVASRHEFNSGYDSNDSADGSQLSRDGLTLLYHGYGIFTRSSTAVAWEPQLLLNEGFGRLSSDGQTAVNRPFYSQSLYIYTHTKTGWSEQKVIDFSSVSTACAQDCVMNNASLSSDGNLLAFNLTQTYQVGGAYLGIYIYARDGNTWVQKAHLTPDFKDLLLPSSSRDDFNFVLSGDGQTLAMSVGRYTTGPYNTRFVPTQIDDPQPHVFLLRKSITGAWVQEAHLQMDLVSHIDLASWSSEMRLSSDGNVFVVTGQYFPRNQPWAGAIGVDDLTTCGNKPVTSWKSTPFGIDPAVNRYMAVYERMGDTWRRQAVLPRPERINSWWANTKTSLSPDGSELFYDGQFFMRRGGVWTCDTP